MRSGTELSQFLRLSLPALLNIWPCFSHVDQSRGLKKKRDFHPRVYINMLSESSGESP